MATGVPKPACPRRTTPGEGDEDKLEAAVGGDSGEALLKRDEGSALYGEVIEVDDGKNDRTDGKRPVACAVGCGGEGETDGHVEDVRAR